MIWVLVNAPVLLLALLGWVALGWLLAQAALDIRDGVVVTALALPLGLAAHVLLVNVACHAVPLKLVAAALPWCEIAAAALAYWRGKLLVRSVGGRGLAVALVGCVVLLGAIVLHAREVWADDSGHATMVGLLAAGHFPLRFQCNPEMAASYPYGGDLLAAAVSSAAGIEPWEAMDIVRPAALSGVLMMAMAVGWSVSRSSAAGPLAAGLLLTAGPMVWILLPLSGRAGESAAGALPLLQPLVRAVAPMADGVWSVAVQTPGFITPVYAHTQRSLSWVFAPLLPLLALLLLEAKVGWRRQAPAIALLVAAAALLHAAMLVMLLPMLVCFALLSRADRTGSTSPSRRALVLVALAVGLGLAAWQGGQITDIVADRLAGRLNETSSLKWAFPQLPSCRGKTLTATCALLSVLNLGVVPLLLPWIVLRLRAVPGMIPRVALLAGCLASYAIPLCFRYYYQDWNLQRLVSYASWMVAVLAAPLAIESFQSGGRVRRAAWLVALTLACTSGLLTTGIVLSGRGIQDAFSEDFRPLPSPLDLQLMPLRASLPLEARFFDPTGCLDTTGTRPGYLFGRYVAATNDRIRFRQPLPAFAALSANPQPEVIAASGYTHLYIDGDWYGGLTDAARDGLARAPVRVLGAAGQARDFRALLAVCSAGPDCPGFRADRDVPR